jgi:two-component sensor histidine kinase
VTAGILRGDGARRWPVAATVYAVVVSTLIATLILVHLYPLHGPRPSLAGALLWQGAIYATWGALVPLIARLVSTAPPRFARLAIAGFVLVPLHAVFSVIVQWRMRYWPLPPSPPNAVALHGLFIDRLPVDMLIYLGIVGALIAREYAEESRRRGVAAAEAEALLARARLEALSARLQPHFLFNALQAIATLIRRDPDGATRMTARLGDLLRASLNRSGGHEVTLAAELELLRAYLDIELVRFPDRLRVEYEIAPDARACLVPDLVLQPLVENAIRHGIAPIPTGGTIRIGARRDGGRLTLTVADDGAGLRETPVDPENGVGLAVTRERLAQLYGGEARLALSPGAGERGTVASIEMPARTGLAT